MYVYGIYICTYTIGSGVHANGRDPGKKKNRNEFTKRSNDRRKIKNSKITRK